MKLRRAMAVAAATAVIAPAALLVAPAAYATTPTPSETATAPAPSESAPTSAAPSASTSATASASETAPAPSASASSPAASATASTSASPSTPTKTPSPSATAPTSPDDICDFEGEPSLDENLRTSLDGLPSKIVAGSGFHQFELNVSNKGKNAYKRVDLGVFTAQVDEDTWEDTTGHLTLQYKDPESGKWIDISLDEDDAGAGYLGYTDVKAKETFTVDLRVSVDKSAPAGFGYAMSIGIYADDEGNCVYADDESYYEFDILASGTKPGDVEDAKPQEGGKKPLPSTKPAGDKEIKVEGNLAETGSDSMVPVIGIVGGIAVVAGAGVMFAMKRRRGDATA
ncbi:LAETG motif-containing sortase-dependent surface protein [Streptomyces sp. NPDC051907]|uniref:LAETG motif-containing sortase-dependent surface protein n=1 Tax=Streptomyces sp. NPDC051907 TaxID=3155284 RepID=UPI00344825B4